MLLWLFGTQLASAGNVTMNLLSRQQQATPTTSSCISRRPRILRRVSCAVFARVRNAPRCLDMGGIEDPKMRVKTEHVWQAYMLGTEGGDIFPTVCLLLVDSFSSL